MCDDVVRLIIYIFYTFYKNNVPTKKVTNKTNKQTNNHNHSKMLHEKLLKQTRMLTTKQTNKLCL